MADTNILYNGGFEQWSKGSGPFTSGEFADGWNLVPGNLATTTVQPSNSSEADDSSLLALKVNHVDGSTDSYIYQTFAYPLDLPNAVVSLSLRVKAPNGVANAVRASIVGGASETFSAYYTGAGAWQTLTIANVTLNPARDKLTFQVRVYFEVSSGVGAYFFVDNVMLAFNASAPTFVPTFPDPALYAPQLVSAYGSRPTAGRDGRIHFSDNASVISVDTGDAWKSYYRGALVTPPPQSGWTEYNFSGGITQHYGYYRRIYVGTQVGDSCRWSTRPLPAGAFDLIVGFEPGHSPDYDSQMGVGIVNVATGSGKADIIQNRRSSGNMANAIVKFSNYTTYASTWIPIVGNPTYATESIINWMVYGGMVWQRLVFYNGVDVVGPFGLTRNDGDVDFLIGPNGTSWYYLTTRNMYSDLTGNKSDWRVGLCLNAPSNVQGAEMALVHWSGVA